MDPDPDNPDRAAISDVNPSGITTNTGGPLLGILWNHDGDSSTPEIPYAFKTAYTVLENDLENDEETPDVNETEQRQSSIADILRDAFHAEQTAFDISHEYTSTFIREARGISAGLDAAAKEDIAALIACLDRLKAQAELGKEALETALMGEHPGCGVPGSRCEHETAARVAEEARLRTEANRLAIEYKDEEATRLRRLATRLERRINQEIARPLFAFDAIEDHITAIETMKTRVEHDTETVAALHVQELLMEIATQKATPIATHLVRRTSDDIEELDAMGEAVFARRPAEDRPHETPPATYADYGMWLTGTDEDTFDIQARAALIGPDPASRATPNITTRANGRNNLGFDSATYSGTARGLSARSRYEGASYVTASGHFLADVELNATFGGTPTLGGTIDGFRSADPANQGRDHVNPAWSLTLQGWSPDSTDATGGLGTFADGDPDTQETARGHWSAWMHGPQGRRPDGIYGGFVAAFRDDAIDQAPDGTNGDGSQTPDDNLFDDGAAIGVYSTVRE
ncbi:MAG: hypothetical protein OXC91_09805 [Rhodobacteraceae bacterium]|nr:hypothetical protein [Paracoccaceae bacterium]